MGRRSPAARRRSRKRPELLRHLFARSGGGAIPAARIHRHRARPRRNRLGPGGQPTLQDAHGRGCILGGWRPRRNGTCRGLHHATAKRSTQDLGPRQPHPGPSGPANPTGGQPLAGICEVYAQPPKPANPTHCAGTVPTTGSGARRQSRKNTPAGPPPRQQPMATAAIPEQTHSGSHPARLEPGK